VGSSIKQEQLYGITKKKEFDATRHHRDPDDRPHSVFHSEGDRSRHQYKDGAYHPDRSDRSFQDACKWTAKTKEQAQ